MTFSGKDLPPGDPDTANCGCAVDRTRAAACRALPQHDEGDDTARTPDVVALSIDQYAVGDAR